MHDVRGSVNDGPPAVAVSPAVMASVPLLAPAVGLVLGVVADRSLQATGLVYGLAFVAVAGLAAYRPLRQRYGTVLVAAGALCCGAALHLAARTNSADSIARYASTEGAIVRVTGRVASEPQHLAPAPNPFARWTFASAQTAFLLDVREVEGEDGRLPVSGRIRVNVNETVLDLRENEQVEVFGRIYALAPPRNPGSFDWAAYHRQQGIAARMNCDRRLSIRRLEPAPATGRRTPIIWARQRARGLLTDDLAAGAPEQVSLLEAMVLGHRSRFDRRLNDMFTRAGVIHFIAVSGTNVAVLMSFVWFIGRLFRRTRRQCTALMAAAVLLYACVADPRPPILRATVMGVLFCMALWMRRPRAHLNWICAAAVVLILIDPRTVFDAGFQLSFAAVLAVTYLAPALLAAARSSIRAVRRPYAAEDAQLARAARAPPSDSARLVYRMGRGAVRTVVAVVAASIAAWLVALPIVMTYFHQVQVWAPISSAVVFPMMSAVMLLGLAKVLAAAISPTAAAAVAFLLDPLDRWLISVVEVFSRLPGAGLLVPPPPAWLIAVYGVFLLVFIVRFTGRQMISENVVVTRVVPYRPLMRAPRLLLPLLAVLLTVGIGAWCWPSRPRERLVMTVLAVGRGSATVIDLPDGRTILYDVGSSHPSDVGGNTIVPFLVQRGTRRIDRTYVSHPNLDHFSGLPTVLTQMNGGPVILNSCFQQKTEPRSPSAHLLDLLAEGGHTTSVLDSSPRQWELGGVTFELLSPVAECDSAMSANDRSTVLKLSYAGHSILLTGDIEDRAQRALLSRGQLDADVLLLPHHGSVRPTTRAFIEAVSPSVAIRSSHEQTDDTLNGIDKLVGGAVLYNTADVGAIEVVLDRDGVHVSTPCSAQYRDRHGAVLQR